MANFIVDDIKRSFGANGNAVVQLLVINIAVFLLVGIADAIVGKIAIPPHWIPGIVEQKHWPSYISWWLSLKADVVNEWYQIWGLVTYNFLHREFLHIFFNMLVLYFMGRLVQDRLGAKRVWALYLLGGIGGGLLYLITYNLFHLIFPANVIWSQASYLLGASASVMAVMVAAAMMAPDLEVRLFFFLPVKLKWVAIGFLVLTSLLEFTSNTGGKMAHLGGAFVGYAFIRLYQQGNDLSRWLDVVAGWFNKVKPKRTGRARMRVVESPRRKTDSYYAKRKIETQRRTNEILDKISKSGYDSLSDEEKSFLSRLSDNK